MSAYMFKVITTDGREFRLNAWNKETAAAKVAIITNGRATVKKVEVIRG